MLSQTIIGESRDDCGKKCGNAGTRFSKSELFGGFPGQIWWKPWSQFVKLEHDREALF